MNEITKIHLGRQAFTIAVDAHKLLRDYLHDINRQVGDKGADVLEEVELRIAELLTERGISGDKVVLVKDIQYVKKQLGEPADFKDDADDSAPEEAPDNSAPKRLFRDTHNAMIAGVCAGIAKYLGVDVMWVRLAFVAFVLFGGSGILIYILLWLMVPEARTNSERLQMQGKPVTVDTLKEVVDRADVKGTAGRARSEMAKIFRGVFGMVRGVVGLVLLLAGIMALFGLVSVGIYLFLNSDIVPGDIFPVGWMEVLLLVLAMLAAAIVSLFVVIAGLAVTKRKWPLPGWASGALIAVFLASVAVGSALAADAVPKIRDRYEAAQHTYTRAVPEFTTLQIFGEFEAKVRYEESLNPSVAIEYWGDKADFSEMIIVNDQTLTVDARTLSNYIKCKTICLFRPPVKEVIIKGPKLEEVMVDADDTQLVLAGAGNQVLKVAATDGSVRLSDVVADTVKAELGEDGAWLLSFTGNHEGDGNRTQEIILSRGEMLFSVKSIDLKFSGQCESDGNYIYGDGRYIYLSNWFEQLTVNGQPVGVAKDLRALKDKPGQSAYKCLLLTDPFLTEVSEIDREIEFLPAQ